MAIDQHVINSLPAYALGILEGEEERQVSEHLSQCSVCAGELEAYQLVASQLALAAPDRQPPSRLKQAILEQAEAAVRESRAARPTWPQPAFVRQPALSWRERLSAFFYRAAPVWGVASLVLIVVLAATSLFLYNQVRQQSVSMNQFHVIAMVGTDSAPQARGVLVSSPDGRYGTLVVDGLPNLDAGKTYQLWLNRDGDRVSGGLFTVGRTGYGALKVDPHIPLSQYNRFGITIEPEGGSPGPTGAKVMGGET